MKKLILSFTLMTLSGCTAWQMRNMKSPKVELSNVDLKESDTSGLPQLQLVFTVTNPNDFAIHVDSLDYQVEAGDRTIAHETLKNPPEVPALKSARVELPLRLHVSQLFHSIGDLLQFKAIDLKVSGIARIGAIGLPFKKQRKLQFNHGQLQITE